MQDAPKMEEIQTFHHHSCLGFREVFRAAVLLSIADELNALSGQESPTWWFGYEALSGAQSL
jgi:hypothetical protein